ncbi:MAG: hypothetical protein OXH86_15825, partial [Acidimicrobiaceae bacterium]|nr:hypothetical protein [Acidimicrobiaceae bacterium]
PPKPHEPLAQTFVATALAELPGLRRRVLAYRGQRSFRTEDGIDVWTMPQLHHALAADELWP